MSDDLERMDRPNQQAVRDPDTDPDPVAPDTEPDEPTVEPEPDDDVDDE